MSTRHIQYDSVHIRSFSATKLFLRIRVNVIHNRNYISPIRQILDNIKQKARLGGI
jgi:hypothetical protein